MSPKSKFILSIVILTVLLIGFLTGAFISGVFLSIKGFTAERLGLLLVSLGFAGVTLVKIIRLNNKETKSRIDAVVNDRHDFIAQWKIPEGQWHDYLKEKLSFDIKESTSYGYISGGIVAVILAFSVADSYAVTNLVIIGVATFLVVFILVKAGIILVAKRKYGEHIKLSTSEVYFAKELIIINGRLTILSDFGYRLKACKVEEKFETNVLSFVVETGTAHRKNHHQYYIPIPENEYEEASRLVTLYTALID